jgi:hypothetical protein
MITNRGKVKAIKSGLLAALFVLAATASQAGPLNVTTVVPYPDIATGFLTTTYRATTGALTINGWALSLDTGSGTKSNITTNFSIQAMIDSNGQLVTGPGVVNQMTIGTAASPLLKSVNLLAFGYSYDAAKGGALEFLFGSPTGTYTTNGNAALGIPSTFNPAMPLDALFNIGTGFLGNFAADWQNSGGTGDVRSGVQGTPEPSALLLTLVGGAGLMWFRRRQVTALEHC